MSRRAGGAFLGYLIAQKQRRPPIYHHTQVAYLSDSFVALDYFESKQIPFVVAVSLVHQDAIRQDPHFIRTLVPVSVRAKDEKGGKAPAEKPPAPLMLRPDAGGAK